MGKENLAQDSQKCISLLFSNQGIVSLLIQFSPDLKIYLSLKKNQNIFNMLKMCHFTLTEMYANLFI